MKTKQAVGGGEVKVAKCKRCKRPYPPGKKVCPRCSDPAHDYETTLKDDMKELTSKWMRRVGL